jgi:hypothetical protein
MRVLCKQHPTVSKRTGAMPYIFQKLPITDTFVQIIHIVLSSCREEIRVLCLRHPDCFLKVQSAFIIVFLGQEMKQNALCVLKCHQQLSPLAARCAHPQVNPDLVLSSFHFCGLHCTVGGEHCCCPRRYVPHMKGISADDIRT